MSRHDHILQVFNISLILKALNGALEVVGGILVLLVPPMFIVRVAEFVTAGELANDPDDSIATYLREAAHTFAIHTHYFIAIYLILHGIVKMLLVAGIFTGRRIAYPIFICTLAVLGSYEAYRGTAHHELLLQVLAAFDIILLVLAAYDYRYRYPELT